MAAARGLHGASLVLGVLLLFSTWMLWVPQAAPRAPLPRHTPVVMQYIRTTLVFPDAPGAADPQEPSPIPPDFNFNKVVAIVAFDRYEYFREVVEGLRQAWGSNQYLVTITIDGPPANTSVAFNRQGWQNIVTYSQQLQWLARHGHGFRDVLINVSDHNMGLWRNKKQAVAGAMELSDYVVILEDDIVVQRDALRWFEWHVTSGLIFRRPEIATASCFAPSFPFDSQYVVEGYDLLAVHTLGMLDKYFYRNWSTPWGWATWKRTWQALGTNWTGQDINLARAIQRQGWGETIPVVARCNNIGAKGVHKEGADKGHIHERAIASNSFPSLDRCQYTEWERGQSRLPDSMDSFVRNGISPSTAGMNATLEQLRKRMLQFVEHHPDPTRFHSTC